MNKTAIELIAQEREEQINKHGFTVQYDAGLYDEDVTGRIAQPSDLVVAAQACIYGSRVLYPENHEPAGSQGSMPLFPSSWKDNPCVEKICNKKYKDRLIIAGALIAAEIDRLTAKGM